MRRLELVLLNGERRVLTLQGGSGTTANALARLDDWIETDDGGWVQKSFIVEVRAAGDESGSAQEYQALDEAAGRMAETGLPETDRAPAATD